MVEGRTRAQLRTQECENVGMVATLGPIPVLVCSSARSGLEPGASESCGIEPHWL